MIKQLLSLILLLAVTSTLSAKGLKLENIEEKLGLSLPPNLVKEFTSALKQYNRGKKNKSFAVAFSEDGAVAMGWMVNANSEYIASVGATQECERQRATLALSSPCEIVLMKNHIVPLGLQMRATASENSKLLLWKIEGEVGEIYLAGSIHVLKPTLLPLPAAYDEAFIHADQIALENNPLLQGDPDRVSAINILMSAAANSESFKFDRKLKKRLRKHFKSQGVKYKQALNIHPAFLALQFANLRMASLGYTSANGLEQHYARNAIKTGKAVIELETPEAALGIFANLPIKTQHDMLSLVLDSLEGSQESIHELIQTWIKGDVDQLYTLVAEDFPGLDFDLSARILNDRNALWLPKIGAFLQQDKTTFVLVGAAHLGGENGLLNLLKQQGYQATRINTPGWNQAAP